MGKKGLVVQLGLVLQLDPVPGFMVPDHVLKVTGTMIFSISLVSLCGNLQWLTRVVIWVFRA